MFPSIPENTIRAARVSFGRGNIYLRLGDQLNGLITKIDADLLTIQFDGYMGTLLAALTLIQYVEGLTDNELSVALHGRVDLRYALHLPTPGPRLDASLLCGFRQRVLKDDRARSLLEQTFKVLYPEVKADELNADPGICLVIQTICTNTIRAAVVESMFHAIEALSANHFTWLRKVALPHWYERYSHSLLMLDSGLSIRQKEFTLEDVRADIEYLIQAADQSNSQMINEVPEVKTLRSVWNQLINEKPEDHCAYCFSNSFERRLMFGSTDKNSAQAR
jgi:transposase